MSDYTLLAILIAGGVVIYVMQKSPYFKFESNRFLHDLFDCSLCLGVWIYFILSALLKVVLFRELFYAPLVSEIITACLLSFVQHVFMIGWKEKFSTVIVVE